MKTQQITKEQAKAAIQTIQLVAEIIREAGSIPSGHLYAALMAKGMELEGYNFVINFLKDAKLVREEFHVLHWIPIPVVTMKEEQ